jgi:hypothetical protein
MSQSKEPKKKKVPYSVMLEEADLELLKKRAAEIGIPPAIVARQIISFALKRVELMNALDDKTSKVIE